MSIDVASEMSAEYPIFSYTATKLSPREVARSFVPPPAFETLLTSRNAILVGPRGSGKTTLLKMLTPEALSVWNDDYAERARRQMTDVGVFIGVDAMWSEQIQPGGDSSPSFGSAAYGLHIGRAFANTVAFRLGKGASANSLQERHVSVVLTKSDEAMIARRASRLFKLEREASSILGLSHALGDRLNELGTYRYRVRDGAALPDWAYLNPLHAIAELAEMVNEATGELDKKWALLFDELELAPDAIVQDILRRLRGNEGRLIFKLSLAPILRSTDLLLGERGATHGQDVEYIPLASSERSDEFVAEIFVKQRQAHGYPASLTPTVVLGESLFDGGSRGQDPRARIDPYRRGGRVWQAMNWLGDHDPTFAEYLQSNRIDLRELDLLPAGKRASHVRKIRNIALVRAHFRQGARRDTQASRQLYTGEATMLALTDGNPRMSTILVRDLLRDLEEPTSIPLDRKVQASAIEATANRFMALLYAQTGLRLGSRAFTVVNFLDAVGEALHARVVKSAFSADVPAGFFVDEGFPERLMPLVKQAVNTGAIIHVPKDDTSAPVASSARGRHYRLSYLLAPRYGLPIRQGKTVALWNLLQGANLGAPVNREHHPTLLELGDIDD